MIDKHAHIPPHFPLRKSKVFLEDTISSYKTVTMTDLCTFVNIFQETNKKNLRHCFYCLRQKHSDFSEFVNLCDTLADYNDQTLD